MALIRIRIRIRLRAVEKRGALDRVLDRFRRDKRRDSKRDERRAPIPAPVPKPDRGRDAQRDDEDRRRRDRDRDRRDLRDDDDEFVGPPTLPGRDDLLQDIREERDQDGQILAPTRFKAGDTDWVRRAGGVPCPLCAGLVGQRYEEDPGDIKSHPNCRCYAVPVDGGQAAS